MHVEWRRDGLSPPADASGMYDNELVRSIRDEITSSGPVTFARFMERALYDPSGGYYATSTTRPTRSGDFLTAPELHPIFGRTIAAQIDEMWRRLGSPSDFTIREYGAGSGALFLAIVDGLTRLGSPLAASVSYEPVDLPAQIGHIEMSLGEAGLAGRIRPAVVQPSVGVVVANEFLDALPVHRVIKLNNNLREIYVDWRDNQFTEVAGALTDARLASWFGDRDIELAEGQRAEANLAMLDWVATVAGAIERGYVLVIDYGASGPELYGPTRMTGTIRAFAGQRVSSDVLGDPGTRDITSHVNFDAFEDQARACGFDLAGRRRSNEFLITCGLDDTYAQARAESDHDWDAAIGLRSAIQRLVDPNALGGYLVSVLARDAPVAPPLRGFTPLNPSR